MAFSNSVCLPGITQTLSSEWKTITLSPRNGRFLVLSVFAVQQCDVGAPF